MLTTLFFIDIKRMNSNEPVLFSTWGYDYAPPIDLREEEIEIAVTEFLVNRNDSEINHHQNEKWFASLRMYLIEEKKTDTLYNIYAWVLEESYYYEKMEVKQGSGSSIPYKFTVEKRNGDYIVTNFIKPRDGSLYAIDMKEIFPRSVLNDMDNIYYLILKSKLSYIFINNFLGGRFYV